MLVTAHAQQCGNALAVELVTPVERAGALILDDFATGNVEPRHGLPNLCACLAQWREARAAREARSISHKE